MRRGFGHSAAAIIQKGRVGVVFRPPGPSPKAAKAILGRSHEIRDRRQTGPAPSL